MATCSLEYPPTTPTSKQDNHAKAQSTATQKEGLKSMDPPESNPSNLRQVVSQDPGLHDTHLVDAPVEHVLDIKSMTRPKRLMYPIQGTWKRLGPSKNKTTAQQVFLPCVGPKRKPEEMCKSDDITLEKKQKLAEEDSTMARTITNNMESVVAASQHRRVQ